VTIKIDQSFVQSFIDGAYGLPIAHENIDYTPVPGTAFVELRNLPNPIESQSLADLNETTGIFRAILNYPVNEGGFTAKTKAEAIMAAYGIGTRVTYSGQSTTITGVQRQPGVNIDGWYRIVVTVTYIAFITR
jgi:hypothetical protein